MNIRVGKIYCLMFVVVLGVIVSFLPAPMAMVANDNVMSQSQSNTSPKDDIQGNDDVCLLLLQIETGECRYVLPDIKKQIVAIPDSGASFVNNETNLNCDDCDILNQESEFLWPVDPLINNIHSAYGWRTYMHENREVTDFHRGIDISAAPGVDIYAVQSGRILTAQYSDSDYGNYVIIDHGNNITTVYAHCSDILVKEGDVVSQGDHIAEIGSTGKSTGSHLHFEVRVNDQHEDPIENGWLIQPQ